jgi:hypothetical protein
MYNFSIADDDSCALDIDMVFLFFKILVLNFYFGRDPRVGLYVPAFFAEAKKRLSKKELHCHPSRGATNKLHQNYRL